MVRALPLHRGGIARLSISDGRAAARRGVTLLELMIALAILIAILAISVPTALEALAERNFATAEESLASTLAMARSHAQREGVMVEVSLRADGRRVVAREISLDSSWTPGMASATPALADAGQGGEPAAISESWGILDFESPLLVTLTAPGGATSDPGGVSAGRDGSGSPPGRENGGRDGGGHDTDAGAKGGERSIALFLPDGSAPITTECWLFDGGRRATHVTIDPVTGHVSTERSVVESATSGDDRDSPSSMPTSGGAA